jgi:hypothetical protein
MVRIWGTQGICIVKSRYGLMCFYRFNYDDIMGLGAEIEFWIDGKKYENTGPYK